MTGVVGLGQRAMAGRQGPEVAAKAAAFDRLGLQVTPANVLGIYAVIMEEVSRLKTAIQMFTLDNGEGMPPLGRDLVSLPAARGFTEATRRLLVKCETDIRDLNRVGEGLVEAAQAYGKTEEHIQAVFDPSQLPSSLYPSGVR